MKRFALMISLATIATFAFASTALAEIPFLQNHEGEEGPQSAYGVEPDEVVLEMSTEGPLPATLVFDKTQADYDKSRGCCLIKDKVAEDSPLAELERLDKLHGIGF
jgi:hypothetical protein